MRYEFTFAHPVSELVQAAFPELQASSVRGRDHTLYGSVVDRAQLDGLLARFGTLGLDLTDIHRLPD